MNTTYVNPDTAVCFSRASYGCVIGGGKSLRVMGSFFHRGQAFDRVASIACAHRTLNVRGVGVERTAKFIVVSPRSPQRLVGTLRGAGPSMEMGGFVWSEARGKGAGLPSGPECRVGAPGALGVRLLLCLFYLDMSTRAASDVIRGLDRCTCLVSGFSGCVPRRGICLRFSGADCCRNSGV